MRGSDSAGTHVPDDASKKTIRSMPTLTGLGRVQARRLWDTTIQKMSATKLCSSLVHELGHYVLGTSVRGSVRCHWSLVRVVLPVSWFLHWALDRWAKDWRNLWARDWASLAVPVLLLQVLLFGFFAGHQRVQPYAGTGADVYGLEVIHGLVPIPKKSRRTAFKSLGNWIWRIQSADLLNSGSTRIHLWQSAGVSLTATIPGPRANRRST